MNPECSIELQVLQMLHEDDLNSRVTFNRVHEAHVVFSITCEYKPSIQMQSTTLYTFIFIKRKKRPTKPLNKWRGTQERWVTLVLTNGDASPQFISNSL